MNSGFLWFSAWQHGSVKRVKSFLIKSESFWTKMPLKIIRGLLRGATRGVLTGKKGNKQFYKGRGVRPPGYHTRKGGYKIVEKKVPEFIVPDLTGFELKPYVSYKAPKVEEPPMTAERLLEMVKDNIHLIKFRETP